MGIRSFVASIWAKKLVKKYRKSHLNAFESQDFWMKSNVKMAEKTLIGKTYAFDKIQNYLDFKSQVPICEYEDFKPYLEEALAGASDIFWPGRPAYFAKTSGTTSGVKYIPISKESMPYHIAGARDALLHYVFYSGNSAFLDRKLIFLSGSPEMEEKKGVKIGRLSGIVNHHVPSYLRSNQLPSYPTNCLEDWESKLDAIVEETKDQDMGLISGIPPWVQMYFDRLSAKSGQKIGDLFPNFQVFVTGGVNFEPYREKLMESIGKSMDVVETYPASEGFIAFQDSSGEEGLLLLIDAGIFYEFVPTDTYFSANPTRLSLTEVELGVNYAILLTTNAGLWAYSIGDTVKFVSKEPYRIVVTGRIKHFISAFGEHVIGEEVEKAMNAALKAFPEVKVTEFTVAPEVNPMGGKLPYHEWFIEFDQDPADLKAFQAYLDQQMQGLNIYYKDLLAGNILQELQIRKVPVNGFIQLMKSQGKLGGQNKVPRLSNDRNLVSCF
ncbi:GH3 auxin-responsive promoter family protein [Sandaracinomonas limnophila]|uniref:GH3 auxin-responsive promoter family protein n=1 Tax=Sandaracinomonas limnophila TaxID=1862386 RepID=A0A437PPT2_9BACT|nr:GH3 auxin-responsive promoter family protein [Sandaracinomonas limnophila]RVU24227.1 GH3 auxin-responsive promoter family protein [Sandaracinomonas limnophila]